MSVIARFMSAATAILADRDSRTERPPFFDRTAWLFVELEQLATVAEGQVFEDIRIARINRDLQLIASLVDMVDESTARLPTGALRHQRSQLVVWIREQMAKG